MLYSPCDQTHINFLSTAGMGNGKGKNTAVVAMWVVGTAAVSAAVVDTKEAGSTAAVVETWAVSGAAAVVAAWAVGCAVVTAWVAATPPRPEAVRH